MIETCLGSQAAFIIGDGAVKLTRGAGGFIRAAACSVNMTAISGLGRISKAFAHSFVL